MRILFLDPTVLQITQATCLIQHLSRVSPGKATSQFPAWFEPFLF